MTFEKIDLSPVCNHKLFYDAEPAPSRENGLDGIYILRKDLRWGEEENLGGVDFKFSFGEYDNVICNSQKLPIGFAAQRIHLISFAYWGPTQEKITVYNKDGSQTTARASFLEWSHPFDDPRQQIIYGGEFAKTIKEVTTSGVRIHKACFHHVACDLNSEKEIAAIELPDNLLLHIFAITFEKL